MESYKCPRYNRTDDYIFVKAVSPINIALIKYWGKTDDKLIMPANDSVSITIDPTDLCTNTEIRLYKCDNSSIKLILNDKEVEITERISRVIQTIKSRADLNATLECIDDQTNQIHSFQMADVLKRRIEIKSNNNFPTAAGLASSSSGLSCLSIALAALYKFQEKFYMEKTVLARLGSGSACRSLQGGFVKWSKGTSSQGK